MSEPTHMLFKDNGYFKVLSYNGKDPKYNAHTWKCECRCGKVIILRTEVINSKKTKSCGCTRKTVFVKGHPYGKRFKPTHGLSKHPLFRVWGRIFERCYTIKPNNKNYPHYRGKGIKIYEGWINNFKSFYDWAIQRGWKQGLSIDRIDSNGNYEPSNCEFVTRAENSKRMMRSRKLNGELNSNSVLTEDQVKEIRKLLNMNVSGNKIASKFGIHRKTVYMIRDKITWSHIGE